MILYGVADKSDGFLNKTQNHVSSYHVTVIVTGKLSTYHIMFPKVHDYDVFQYFSSTAPIFLEDFPLPDKSSAPG
jgi:hypothetical protein